MLYYRDGRHGTVSVMESDVQRLLIINGKIDATSVNDLPTQVMVGQLPLMMHPHPRRVLVIGLGSGITAGAVAQHPEIESIDILEISPAVVAASAYFSEANRRVLDDPRVNLIVADARNYLLGTRDLYDVIISQPSNPWISGISNLFTLDFFNLLQSRLAPDGIACQWMQIYNMARKDVRSVLNSYRTPFPFVSVWLSMSSDFIMIGSPQPHGLDGERFDLIQSHSGIGDQLAAIGKPSLGKIAPMFLFDQEFLEEYCRDAPFNTDDRPRVEFNAPQNLYRFTTEKVLRELFQSDGIMRVYPPIANTVRVSDRAIDAFTVGVKIQTDERLERDMWRAEYQAWSKLIHTDGGGPDILGFGSHLDLEWRDGEYENRLDALHVDHEMSLDQLGAYLLVDEQKILLAGGEVDLPGGARGVWNLCRSMDEPSYVTYAVTWMMPANEGGYHHYIAERNQRDPGPDHWGGSLINFAKCFSPL